MFKKSNVQVVGEEFSILPASNYMFKVNSRKTRAKCEVCSKLSIKTPKREYC